MRTKRYQSKHLDNFFLRDLDLSGALIQGAVFASDHQSSAYFVQALENYNTVKRTHIPYTRTCRSRDDPSFLRYVSNFVVRKAGQWSSQQFLRSALLISRKLHKKCHEKSAGPRALHTIASYPSFANSDSEIVASHADCVTSLQTPSESHHTPPSTAQSRPTRMGDARTHSSRRSTFCGPFITSISEPDFVSPMYPRTLNSTQDPPSTPIKQILGTPLYPPKIENKEPRTPCGLVLYDKELDFTRVSLANARLPEETPYHTYQPNRRLSFRSRLWVRRLSYPHFRTSTVSHLLKSPLTMPDTTNASGTCHQLASPLNVRSSVHTPCTPQFAEDNGHSHLHWSPHCLRCFA